MIEFMIELNAILFIRHVVSKHNATGSVLMPIQPQDTCAFQTDTSNAAASYFSTLLLLV